MEDIRIKAEPSKGRHDIALIGFPASAVLLAASPCSTLIDNAEFLSHIGSITSQVLRRLGIDNPLMDVHHDLPVDDAPIDP